MKKDLEFEKLMAIYNHIGEEERHFNMIELEYRKLASQWLLVSLGAIGYILSKEHIVPIDNWALVMGICVVASIGIFVLWMLDLKVYQKLLFSAFTEGVEIEEAYPDILPRIRTNMKEAMEGKGISSKVFFYYFFSILLLMTIGNIAVWMIAKSPAWLCICGNTCSLTVGWIIYRIMHGRSEKDKI